MIRLISLLTCLLTVAGCSSDVDKAKQLVTDSLVIKAGLEFNDVTSYPGDVVCGGFSAYISYNEPPLREAPFVVTSGTLDRSPTPMKWRILCNKDPAESLYSETGIGPITAESHEILKIIRDMTLLTAILEEYYTDNSAFPLESDGLQALLQKPEADRFTRNYREGGYISGLPVDPWGRQYLYTHTRWGRVKGTFEILTLGQSGEPGGTGLETDVSSSYLGYMLHITHLLGIE